MMRALAGLIVASPLQAVLVIVLCTLLSYLAPPLTSLLSYVGAAALGLYSLHSGTRSGAVVVTGSVVTTAALGELLLHQGAGLVLTSLALWLPVWLAALVLRSTRSLAMSMLMLNGLAMLLVLLVFMLYGDPSPWWQQLLQAMADTLSAQAELPVDQAALATVLQQVAPYMTGMLAAGLSLAALSCLMLARWWQSLLLKPGALRTEFYALRLNKTLALVTLLIVALASLELGVISAVAMQWALIAMVMYLFVGLAVLHASLANLKAATGWLIAVYILMSLIPQVMLMMVVTGLLDPWVDLRRRTLSK
jgi:hypothetical protein